MNNLRKDKKNMKKKKEMIEITISKHSKDTN